MKSDVFLLKITKSVHKYTMNEIKTLLYVYVKRRTNESTGYKLSSGWMSRHKSGSRR